jgi:F-type H+-transporting ATPase subunit epsilon
MPLPESIQLEVVTPDKRVVSEVVDEVILPGSEGSLGVLPGHTPLLTTLGIGELVYRRGGARRYVAIAWGFAEVLPDRVSVLAEIAERAEGIDRERAARARDRALERLRERPAETDFKRAQVALQKAIIRIQVSQGTGPNGSA